MKITFKYKNYFKKNINDFLLSKGYSDNNIFYLIKNKNVLVDYKVVNDKNYLLYFNAVIKVTLNEEVNELYRCNKPINIVYEDDYLLIVDKEKYDDVEPTKSNYENSLANKISYYFDSKNINSKIHLVNRLYKLTSGLFIIAKNQYIHNLMSKVNIEKKYITLVKGKTNKKGLIKVKIKKEDNSIKRVISDEGKLSLTKYKLIKYIDDNSLVEVKLLTGRTHQIRVSFESINHPLIGDPIYSKDEKENMLLRAYFLSFIHPISKRKLVIKLSGSF